MQASMLLGIFSWISDLVQEIKNFFRAMVDLIPKLFYLLYTSLACVIDILQLFFRKLAGLDVYYVEGEAITGDLVTNFITGILGINPHGLAYSALSTVFYAMIVFGVIVCFIATLVAIIKSHYTYDEKSAKGPMQYIYTAGKAIINMVAVPIIVVLGLYVSEALLTALDSITSTNSSTIERVYGDKVSLLTTVDIVKGGSTIGGSTTTYRYEPVENWQAGKTYYKKSGNTYVAQPTTSTQPDDWRDTDGNLQYYVQISVVGNSTTKTYIFYDFFGVSMKITYSRTNGHSIIRSLEDRKEMTLIGSKNETFSGALFKTAAYNANRVRNSGNSKSQISDNIKNNLSGYTNAGLFSNATTIGQLAEMVDLAFSNNLQLNNSIELVYYNDASSAWSSPKYFNMFDTNEIAGFSKFNIGAVWYYYDLWKFNFIVGFAGLLVCTTIFINIIMGLMARLFMCIVLFLVAPPLFGLAPLDGGKAGGNWRTEFMKQVLMTYGAVVGMNLMLMILPYMNTIDFFNIEIADYFARTLLIIVGLITIKAVIQVLSSLIGAADANKTGGETAKEAMSTAGKAVRIGALAAKAGVATVAAGGRAAIAGARMAGHGAATIGHGLEAGGKRLASGIQSKRAENQARKSNQQNQHATDLTRQSAAALRKGQEDKKIIEKAGAGDLDTLRELRNRGMTDAQISDSLVEHGMHFKDAEALMRATEGLDLSKGKADVMKQATSRASQRAADLRSQAAAARSASNKAALKSTKLTKSSENLRMSSGESLKAAGQSAKETGRAAKDTARKTFTMVGTATKGVADTVDRVYGKNELIKGFTDEAKGAEEKKKAREKAAQQAQIDTGRNSGDIPYKRMLTERTTKAERDAGRPLTPEEKSKIDKQIRDELNMRR